MGSVDRTDAPPRAGNLEYVELMTGGARTTDRVPLVVGLHGLGDRPRAFAGLFRGFDKPARLVLLRAPTPYSRGFAWWRFRPGRPDSAERAAGIRSAATEVARAIRDLLSKKPVRGLPVVTGFSQGGMLSFALAALHPEVTGTAIPISGGLPSQLWPAPAQAARRLPPVHALHGDADALVPIGPARKTVEQLRGAGFDATLKEFSGVEHRVPTPVRQELFRLLGEACERAAAEEDR